MNVAAILRMLGGASLLGVFTLAILATATVGLALGAVGAAFRAAERFAGA